MQMGKGGRVETCMGDETVRILPSEVVSVV